MGCLSVWIAGRRVRGWRAIQSREASALLDRKGDAADDDDNGEQHGGDGKGDDRDFSFGHRRASGRLPSGLIAPLVQPPAVVQGLPRPKIGLNVLGEEGEDLVGNLPFRCGQALLQEAIDGDPDEL